VIQVTWSPAAVPTLEPSTADELASALRGADDARQVVMLRGAGTKIDWGRPPARVDAILSTRRLNRLVSHQHGDLTATVEAGATLRDLNESLARYGQWLPLDPPFADRATIGGLLATNDSGPLRHRFGTPRDLVIGVRLASADGTLAKAGGQVVKNVAGYDLSKLMCGSFGSLAAIVTATFKLAPLPSASKTLVVNAPDVDTLALVVRDVMASQLEPIAFELTGATALLRFASVPAAVDAQIEQTLVLAAVKRCTTSVVEGDAERARWDEHAETVWNASGAIVRASWLPADLARAAAILRGFGTDIDVVARAALGAGLLRIGSDAHAQAAIVGQLRQSPTFRNVVIVRGSDELKSLADVWGPPGDRARLFASLRHALDPHGTLDCGRGPL
jgi:glycolate oxidase FAD binding subunit